MTMYGVAGARIKIAIASETSLAATGEVCQPAPVAVSHAEVLRVIFGVMICILLAALDQTAVIPAVPAIAHGLGAYG